MAGENVELDTLPKLLLHHSRQRGERPAIREKSRGIWRTTTWRQLADEAAALRLRVAARGLKRGEHVALVGDNRPRLYAAMAAAQWLGGVVVPLYQDASATELAPALKSAEAAFVFAENQEQVDKLLEILPQCPSVRCIVYDDDRGMRHYKQPQLVSYEAVLHEGRGLVGGKRDWLRSEASGVPAKTSAFLFFTSGTTGPAKGVVLAHASLIDRARVAALAERLEDTDVAMAYLPLGWIGQNLFSLHAADGRGLLHLLPGIVGHAACRHARDGPDLFPGATAGARRPACPGVGARRGHRRAHGGSVPAAAWYWRGRVGAPGESVSPWDRIAHAACDLLVYAPLRDVLGMSRIRVAFTGGDAVDPGLMMVFPLHRHQPEAALRLDRDGLHRRDAARR